MPIDYAALKAKILAVCPAQMVAARNDDAIAAFMNAPGTATVDTKQILQKDLLKWAASVGFRSTVETTAANTSAGNAAMRAICLSIKDMISGLVGPPLDMTDPTNSAMISALRSANLLSAAQETQLRALAVKPCSHAESLLGYGVFVSHTDVGTALNLG